MSSRNYDMASNMENNNIQQALLRYDMRNNDYQQPDIFRYGQGRDRAVRTDRSEMAVNNRALERKIGGSCGCSKMSGGAVSNILSEMDNRYDGITNKNFTNPYRQPQQYIQSGNINFVPYYNMIELAEINSTTNANNVLSGRGIDFGKYANKAKDIGAKIGTKYINDNKQVITDSVKGLMKNPDVKQLAREAMEDPAVIKAVNKIMNEVKTGGGWASALGKVGSTALSVGSKVGTAGLKYGAVAVEVGAKYGAKGVAVATAVASNPAVQKVAQAVIDNPQVQEAVVGIIAEQVAKIAPAKPAPITDPDEEPTGGGIRNKKAYIKRLKAQYGKKGGMISFNRLKELAKEKLKGKKNTTQETIELYEDDDDFFREDEDEEKMYKKLLKEKPSATKNQKGTEMSDMSGSGAKGGKNKRALIVKRVMKEQGLGLIQASKYVKQHNLY
jgi:hypothetical protein